MARATLRRTSIAAAALAGAFLSPDADRPAVAATTPYEAESAALSGGAAIAADDSGDTGTSFVVGHSDTSRPTGSGTSPRSMRGAATAGF